MVETKSDNGVISNVSAVKGDVLEKKDIRGSFTIEAAIIIPVVILCILSAVYMGVLLYQKTLLQSAVEMAVEEAASVWNHKLGGAESGESELAFFSTALLYNRLFDAGRDARLEIIKDRAIELAAVNELLKPVNTVASVKIRNHFICRRLEIELIKQYSFPLGNLMKMFGGKETVTMVTRAVSTINEPAEAIRNIDFAADLEKKLENKYPEFKSITDKTRNVMNEIKQKINKFME